MEEFLLLRGLVIVWIAALLSGLVLARMRMPLSVGYILAGVVIGPHCLRLVQGAEQIHELAEVGVALLLFALGVEMSLKQILRSSKKVVAIGVAQLLVTAVVFAMFGYVTGVTTSAASAFLLGCVCALSSTVVVTKLLVDRGEIESLHGRIMLPVLIIQDLSLVPVISVLPALGNPGADFWGGLAFSIGKGLVAIIILLLLSIRLMPILLGWVAKLNSRELFFLCIMSICLGISMLSHYLGLSIAVGAFLAGIIVSDSPYGHQALADLLPMRDLFATVFFVSVGLLLDPAYLGAHALEVGIFVAFLIAGKAIIAALCTYAAIPSVWTASLVGVGLAQMGEFSFVLATLGFAAGIINEAVYNLLFAGAALSLLISPGLISAFPALLHKLAFGKQTIMHAADSLAAESEEGLTNHMVICGYGRIGRNLGRVFSLHEIPFVAVDLNAALLTERSERSTTFIYGDAFNRHVLEKAHLDKASCLIITIPDPLAALGIINMAREFNKEIPIVVRVHRTEDIDLFRAAGANAVVQPEFEASIEISRLSLLAINRTGPEIKAALEDIRRHRYNLFRPDIAETGLSDLAHLPEDEYVGVWFLIADASGVCGKSIRELDVRKESGAHIMAIRRAKVVISHPDPDEKLLPADEVYVVGTSYQLENFQTTFGLHHFYPQEDNSSSLKEEELLG